MSNPWAPEIKIMPHGREGEPVIVIDNAAPDPDALARDAAVLSFQPIGQHYPGVRAAVPLEVIKRLLAPFTPAMQSAFGFDGPLDRFESFYSLVTTPPAQLHPIQRVPHFDSVEPGKLAVLHYLTRDERGGTAFYRHRRTGFEKVTAERLQTYMQAVNEDSRRLGLPPARYISGDTPIFEQIAHHGLRYNRILIYRGYNLHSGDIPDGLNLSADPRHGRLTLNTFVNATHLG